jgi:hypothetical protein
MPGKDGWIYDLVIERYVNFADLKNGSLDLIDLIKISDAHLINMENQLRIQEHVKKKSQ